MRPALSSTCVFRTGEIASDFGIEQLLTSIYYFLHDSIARL